MACRDCPYFNVFYHNGYCERLKIDTSPNSSCGENGEMLKRKMENSQKNKTCYSCKYFDEVYHGGYCNRHQKNCKPDESCLDYW